MKKLGKFLVVAGCAAMACAALAGCGGPTEYKGTYKYANPWEETQDGYGVTVTVTVDGDTIKSVTCTDPEGYHNITASWDEGNGNKAANGLNDYLKKFEGKKVADVKAIKVSKNDKGVPDAVADVPTTQGDMVYTGATQTSGRIILAVQDALKDVK